jgi:hypothetical protein
MRRLRGVLGATIVAVAVTAPLAAAQTTTTE